MIFKMLITELTPRSFFFSVFSHIQKYLLIGIAVPY